MSSDIRELDARAVRASVALVSRATPDDLERPTPCEGWTLRDLLAHMTIQHYGFAAAARGEGADLARWQPVQQPDPVAGYAEAAEFVIAAFAADGVLDVPFALPEISATQTFPAGQAISFHCLDYVVHSWDVAQSLGVQPELDDDLVTAALRIGRLVPEGASRLVPGAAFGPGLPSDDIADPLLRLMAILGRTTLSS
jgi:uncharacterized protein (TIGR03086 family)